MKKGNITLIIAGVVLTGILLFSTCSNVFSPSNAAGQQGNVTVSFSAGPSGRTITPSILDFDLYEFTFKNSSYNETFSKEKDMGGSFTFSVPVGNGYTLNVKAYKGTGGGKILAAEGDSGAFAVGGSIAVTVKLKGNISITGTGTFSYAIQYPANAEVEHFLLVGGGKEYDLLEGATGIPVGNGMKNDVTVPAGYYGLELDLIDEDGKAAYNDDIVVIYSDTTTFYGTAGSPVVFSSADFKVDPTKPKPVIDWHGFRIITDADKNVELYSETFEPNEGTLYSRYYSGNKAFHHNSFTDPSGVNFKDVFELRPPEDGYPLNTMALIYELPHEGTYTFHMKVWLESGKSGDIHWQYLGGDQNILNSPVNDPSGQWVTLTTKRSHVLENNIVFPDFSMLYLNGNNGNRGLKDATLYIRDVQVTLERNSVREILDESYLNESVINPDDIGEGGGTDPGYGGGPLWLSHTGTITLAQGSMRRITANQGVSWHSSDPSVATANQEPNYGNDIGLIVGMNPGTTTVTVTGGSDSITLNVIVEGAPPAGKKYIALTFDDGPGGYTGEILDAFSDLGARASFFIIGGNVSSGNYNLLRRMREEGHDIANHTYSHDMNLYTWNYAGIKSDLDHCMANIAAATSDNPVTPVYIRAPALFHSQAFSQAAGELGLSFMGGELTYDSGGRDPDANGHNHDSSGGFTVANLVFETLAHARPWGIIINHDNGESASNLAAAMRQVIPQLRAEGYEVVSLSEMVAARKALGLVPGAVYDDFGAVPEDPDFDLLSSKVTSITVAPSSLTLLSGQTGQLSANVQPIVTSDRSVTWSSDKPSVASVNQYGVVTAVALGTATITATTNGVSISGIKLSDTAVVSVVTDLPDVWHGFSIPGLGLNASGATGIKHETLSLKGDYNDVLELIPPSGGYKQNGTWCALPLSYILSEPGTYRLSMKILVEGGGGSQADIVLYGYNRDSMADSILYESNNVEKGIWLDAGWTETFGAGNVAIGLIGLGFGSTTGLRSATAYIRDIKLEKVGEGTIAESAHNEEVADPEEPSDYWHGFLIPGRPENYSSATWVIHDSYQVNGEGTGYQDVLELRPPVGGYQPLPSGWGACPLYYKLPGTGTYKLSMWIYVESNTDADFRWWGTDAGESKFFNEASITKGIWIYRESESYYLEDSAFGELGLYLIGRTGTGLGLKDAVIYIRDFRLTKNGTVVDSSAPNTPVIPDPDPDPEGQVEWHGLKIITEANSSMLLGGTSRYQRYYSGAIGTVYETFTDSTGTYSDVFKVEPPDGYYEKGMALVYDLPEGYNDTTDTFTISMKMWMEGGNDAEIHWQYLGNDNAISGICTSTQGVWVNLSASVPFAVTGATKVFPGSDDFIYLLGKAGSGGLKDATVYIRDVVVTWNGNVLEKSTPNEEVN